ncbi:MAG TPA: aminotransferase class I/II-fold pyridoxal phosphate-dependent enzyme [Gemmatimonadaceae bacterium]|nr:aminotransferase class I/II-fold pyridoxal phosphate-dependent enzyme [Gemmatimonadaceae bacterium]
MHLSRRNFVKAASVSGIGALTVPLIAARGSEALRDGILELSTSSSVSFASDERAASRLLKSDAVRLDSNENPNGPGKVALDAIRAMFDETPRYPDLPADGVRKAVATHLKVAPENVVIGCGSGEILRMAVYAFTSPDRALVTGLPSFEDPVKHAEMTRAQVRAVPVDAQLSLDLGRMLDQTSGAGLVFLCNPNNPTATVHGAAAVRDFVAQTNKRDPECVVMVDEAYHEYVDEPSYATAVPLALENPKVIVVRTFSKVFGMAGLRLGYAIGRPETLRAMQRHRLPNNINVLAAASAIATLPDTAHVERERQLNRAARDHTRKAFESMGYKVGVSNTNFIMVAINRDSKAFKDACAKHGILVGRAFPPLTTHARVSIGTLDEMKKATDVFRQVLSGAAN